MSSSEEAKPGFLFQVVAPGHHSIQQLRDEARAEFGLDIHIRAKFGPTVLEKDGRSIGCPIEAVDDKFLTGEFHFPIPAVGYCLYIGYFLPKED